jgi:hypothetical protein
VSEPVEPETITIVEGPTPEFHIDINPWSLSILEGKSAYLTAACQVRSFNGQKLMERCQRAWRTQRATMLDYKQSDGLRRQVEIVSAQLEKIDGVDVLNLWVRQPVRMLINFDDSDSSLPLSDA